MKKEKKNDIQNEEVTQESIQTDEVENTDIEKKEKKNIFAKKPDKVVKADKEKKPHVKYKDLTKEGKKKRVRRIVLIAIAAIIVALITVSKIAAANVKMPVPTTPVAKGDVEAVISANGNVESDIKKTYYTQVSGTIGNVAVKAGQTVEEGEVLLSFDEQSLQLARQNAQAAALTSDGTYKDAMNLNAKTAGKLTEATVNLDVLEQQITDYKAFVKEQERKYESIKNKREAGLYASQLEAQKNGDGEQLQEIQYLLSTLDISQDLVDIQHTIDDAKETLSNLEEYKTEMKSQKGATEDNVMSGTTSEAKKTTNDYTVATNQQVIDYADAVMGGLKSDFAGVVTEVAAAEGAPVTSGGALVTVSSNKQVHVTVNLSKSDLEKVEEGQKADITIAGRSYEGEVTLVNHMAVMNNNNTPVVSAEVEITNADENIFLGVEAKVKIHAQKSEGTLIVPVQAVNTDKDGNFVYIVENGIVVRKNVTTGVSSDEYIEITEGIKEGEQVMTEMSTTITEGMQVTAIPDVTESTTEAQGE